MTWIEIIDTAVKIGLGSLITAATTFLVARRGHKHELVKERSRRRQDILERAVAQFEEVHDSVIERNDLFADLCKAPRETSSFKELEAKMADQHGRFTAALTKFSEIEGKLLLLGMREAVEILSQYRAEAEYVGDIVPDDTRLARLPRADGLIVHNATPLARSQTANERLNVLRNNWYDWLARQYKQS